MIGKGRSVCSVSYWAKHLVKEDNDRAELKEIRGLAADNLRDGLAEMQRDAAQFTRAKNGMYHININPETNDRLTEAQWERAFEIFEKARGIPEGQPRIVYEHEKEGRVHRHAIYARFDPENMRVFSDAHDAPIGHEAARQIADEFGLKRTVSPYDKDREGPRPERGPKSWEMFRAQRSGVDPGDMKTEVTEIFRESRNPSDFVAGLRLHGYELAKGDTRDYCILDSAGDAHSLARRIAGTNAAELRAFMKDMDRESLPTVAQAKESQRGLRQTERQADLATVSKEIAWEEQLAKNAIAIEEREGRFVEPSPQQIKDALEAEAKWPLHPPTSGSTLRAPHWEFTRAGERVSLPKPEPAMPEKLKGAAAHIWTAHQNSHDANQFVDALKEKHIELAVASKEESEKSHRTAEFAKQFKNFAPRYREGEIVAVTEQGHVYKINRHTTGAEQPKIDRLLRPLDRSKLQGIEPTKSFQKTRFEERTLAIQDTRDKLRDAKEKERRDHAREIAASARKIKAKRDSPALELATSAAGAAELVGGAIQIGAKLAEGLMGIFAPTLTPAQRFAGQAARAEQEHHTQQTHEVTADVAAEAMKTQEKAISRDDFDRDW